MKIRKLNKGFTLIELMVVIAIIGVLAAVAIPQYQNYTIRSSATTALNAIRPVQLAVSEFAVLNKALPDNTDTLPGMGIAATSFTEDNTCNGIVKSVAMDASATVTLTFYNRTDTVNDATECMESAPDQVPSALAGQTLVFQPRVNTIGAVIWEIDGDASTVDPKYFPKMPIVASTTT
jgi:type IV pilus assembly protein PilA